MEPLFLAWHPTVSLRTSEESDRRKAREWTSEECEEWIGFLSELHCDWFLDDPKTVWNLDESTFTLGRKTAKFRHAKCERSIKTYLSSGNTYMITSQHTSISFHPIIYCITWIDFFFSSYKTTMVLIEHVSTLLFVGPANVCDIWTFIFPSCNATAPL